MFQSDMKRDDALGFSYRWCSREFVEVKVPYHSMTSPSHAEVVPVKVHVTSPVLIVTTKTTTTSGNWGLEYVQYLVMNLVVTIRMEWVSGSKIIYIHSVCVACT